LFILDELFSLGYIDEISKAAGLIRGYGLQLWPIPQDIGQLVTLCGREDTARAILNQMKRRKQLLWKGLFGG
jgi:type IV secretory pathway TraG/TraD family ATPase VirD4